MVQQFRKPPLSLTVYTDSTSANATNRGTTVRLQGTLSFGEHAHDPGEDGGLIHHPTIATPQIPDVGGWWSLNEGQRTTFESENEGHRDEIYRTGPRRSSLVFRTAASEVRSASPRLGMTSPFEHTSNPPESLTLNHGFPWDEHSQSLQAPRIPQITRSDSGITENDESLSNPADHPEDALDGDTDDTQEDTLDDSNTVIGTFRHNGKFKCIEPRCARKTFNRQAELRRHYDTIHAPRKPEYWCRVATCPRSRANGGYPFPRRDKLRDHMRKVHGRS